MTAHPLRPERRPLKGKRPGVDGEQCLPSPSQVKRAMTLSKGKIEGMLEVRKRRGSEGQMS